MIELFAKTALMPTCWGTNVKLALDSDGNFGAVIQETESNHEERVRGIALPGIPNLHCHAFQRAMAGLGERASATGDSFWSWREAMYRFTARLTPDDLRAIAAQAYVEMLKAGYTSVCEFHYLHNDADGRPYADPAAMSRAILDARDLAGIGLTLLPVLYQNGGFAAAPPTERQRRFLLDSDRFLTLIETLQGDTANDGDVAIGAAPHSLRAVAPDALQQCLAGVDAINPDAPLHIHIAEQEKEVADCLAWSGARPVEWLLDNANVSQRWCCVHATHMTEIETENLAYSGATAGLCPTTEANLGDGFFPLKNFLSHCGVFGIGSDSNVSVDPREELRWLEYGQRLVHKNRAAIARGTDWHAGDLLYQHAAKNDDAVGRLVGKIAQGRRADLVVLDANHPALSGRSGDLILDAYIFSGGPTPVRDVMVGGNWVVRDGHHEAEEAIARDYRRTLAKLLASD